MAASRTTPVPKDRVGASPVERYLAVKRNGLL
jgi:hypothetical protein